MYPELFKLGPLVIYSWGFLFSIAVLVATALLLPRAAKEGYDQDKMLNLIILLVVSGLIGARLFYVIVYAPQVYLADPVAIFKLWQGGLVWYGGIIGALPVGYWYVKKANLPFWPLADLIAPYLALGYGIVRIGCFLNGCCYGNPTKSWVGVVFPAVDEFLRHPTQIYSSLFGFTLFLVLLLIQRIKRVEGEVFLWGAIIYAIGRGVIESLRENLTVWGNITVSQVISIAVVLLAGTLLWIRYRRHA